VITVEDGLREDSRGIYGTQKPVDIDVYGFAFRDWLLEGELIDSIAVTVPAGLTKIGELLNTEPINDPVQGTFPTNTVVLVWITGGVVNTEYTLLFRVITDSSPARDKTFELRIKIK